MSPHCQSQSSRGDGECRKQMPWVVLVPFPAFGHVNPMIDLSCAILRHASGCYRPVIVNPAFIHRRLFPPSPAPSASAAVNVAAKTSILVEDSTDWRLQENDEGVVFASLPDGIGDNPDFSEINAANETELPQKLDALLGYLGSVACVVVDLLACWAIKVAERRGIQVSGFWPAMFATFKIISAAPLMVQKGLISNSGIPLDTEAMLGETAGSGPAGSLLTTADLPWLIGDEATKKARFCFWQQVFVRSKSISSIIFNSFAHESGYPDGDEEVQEQEDFRNQSSSGRHPQFMYLAAVLQQDPTATSTSNVVSSNNSNKGYKTSYSDSQDDGNSCLEWLARWAPSSVVYVSFGTWVDKIGEDKVKEIALGLEAAGTPFFLVLKDSWRKGLPTGFQERIGERGKLVSWAPQRKVLRHEAVGCFVTHCGWNSTMEAIRFGKCMVCYPIVADQFINSTHIVSVWKVGVRLPSIGRNCLVDCIRKVMVESGDSTEDRAGASMKSRMHQLRERMLGNAIFSAAKDNLESFIKALGG